MNDHVQIRPIQSNELAALLDLYQHLHATDAPLPDVATVRRQWREFLADPKIHCLAAVLDEMLIASCTLAIIPNFTRGLRPYGIIENVVTHTQHRRMGVGTGLLRYALQQAWDHNCYKVMLLTSSKDEGVHQFYERAGFRRGVKTGFIATPEPT